MTEWAVALVIIILFFFIIPFAFLFLNYKQQAKYDIGMKKKTKWKMYFLPPK